MSDFNWEKAAKKQWDQTAQFWNERSKQMWDEGSRKDIIPFLDKHLNQGATILDVGCGDGYGTFKLHNLGYRVRGIDLSAEMIAKAKERLQAIPFQQADVVNLPLESETVDAVLCINVLEWVEVPALALKEIRRILKSDGLVCVGILGPTAGPRGNDYRKVYGEQTICNSMMPWEFGKLAKEMKFEVVNGFGVYKEGIQAHHHEGLSQDLKQALSFMWVFLLQKVGE
jgi:ubiquinone/menaquinone biosynthesis C-methylase UbiE